MAKKTIAPPPLRAKHVTKARPKPRPKDVTQYDLRGIRSDLEVLKHDRATWEHGIVERLQRCERRLDDLEIALHALQAPAGGFDLAEPIHPPTARQKNEGFTAPGPGTDGTTE
jgi:hypothetical protein